MSSLRSANKGSWGARLRKAMQLLGGTIGVLLLCLPLFSQGSSGRILEPSRTKAAASWLAPRSQSRTRKEA